MSTSKTWAAALPLAVCLAGLQAATSAGQPAPRRLPPSVLRSSSQARLASPSFETLPCPTTFGAHLGPGSQIPNWADNSPHGGQWHATLDETGAYVLGSGSGKTLICSYKVLGQSGAILLSEPMGPRYCRARADRSGFECGDRPDF